MKDAEAKRKAELRHIWDAVGPAPVGEALATGATSKILGGPAGERRDWAWEWLRERAAEDAERRRRTDLQVRVAIGISVLSAIAAICSAVIAYFDLLKP